MKPIIKISKMSFSDIRGSFEAVWFVACVITIFANSTIWQFSVGIFVVMSIFTLAAAKIAESYFNEKASNAIGMFAGGIGAYIVQQLALWFNVVSKNVTDKYAQGARYLNVDLTQAPIETLLKVITETFIETPFLVGTDVIVFALLSYLVPRAFAYPLWVLKGDKNK
ncbi:hypothetical protein [Vibrio sp. TRT 29B02]|uniref:hypothetical protein n=1 Tax=Vibrio sp. TRT 29B02 TaxID=3418508 RepID=UPI003CEF9EE0